MLRGSSVREDADGSAMGHLEKDLWVVRALGLCFLPQWAKTVEEKDREIQELKDRLRALEAIHRELEEKRRGLKD
ncbi:hypothetical protein [Desulfosoma sp.]